MLTSDKQTTTAAAAIISVVVVAKCKTQETKNNDIKRNEKEEQKTTKILVAHFQVHCQGRPLLTCACPYRSLLPGYCVYMMTVLVGITREHLSVCVCVIAITHVYVCMQVYAFVFKLFRVVCECLICNCCRAL